jgi:DNA-binding CsgD family transcriptional regulator
VKGSAALAHLRLLCRLGLAAEAVLPAFLAAVRRQVHCDSAAFFWVGPDLGIVQIFAERMLAPAVTRRYFEEFYAGSHSDFRRRLHALAQSDDGIGEQESAQLPAGYWQGVLAQLGAQRIVHVAVRRGVQPLGQMSLYRSAGKPLARNEREFLAASARYLAQLLQAPVGAAPATAPYAFDDSGQGTLLLADAQGQVLDASPRGYALLAQASGCPIDPHTVRGELARRGQALLAPLVAARAAPTPAGEPDPAPPTTVVDNAWGQFQLRAYAAGADCGILIERREYRLVRLAAALGALQLSAQQREVAAALARGLSKAEVAAALGVSLNTAAYHVKQLYQRLDVHGREAMVRRVLAAAAPTR